MTDSEDKIVSEFEELRAQYVARLAALGARLDAIHRERDRAMGEARLVVGLAAGIVPETVMAESLGVARQTVRRLGGK
jgi:hypothetical protein